MFSYNTHTFKLKLPILGVAHPESIFCVVDWEKDEKRVCYVRGMSTNTISLMQMRHNEHWSKRKKRVNVF